MSKSGRKPKPGKGMPAYMRVVEAQAGEAPEDAPAAAETPNLPGEVKLFGTPEWFSPAAVEIFRFLEEHLRRLDVLDEVDQLEMQMLANAFAEWGEVQERIGAYKAKNDGTLIYRTSGRNGTQYKTHPLFHQAADLERRIAALSSNFGLSPVDRERIRFLRRQPVGTGQGDLLD